jgi:hypothetical protein
MSTAPQAPPQIDEDALAKQFGAISSTPVADDEDALAKKFGAISSVPALGPSGHEPTWKDDAAQSLSLLGTGVGHVLSAPVTIAEGIYGMGKRAIHGENPIQPIIDSSVSNFNKAQADTDPYAKAAHYLGSLPMSPVGQIYDKYEAGDMNGLMGDVGDIAGQILLGKVAPEIPAKTTAVVRAVPSLPGRALEAAYGLNRLAPEKLIEKGLRGSVPAGRTNFYENLSTSMPAIKAVEPLYGRPIRSLDDLIGTPQKPGAIQLAKRANRAEFDQLLGPQRAANAQIRLDPVADAIESSISDKTRLENPEEALRIKSIADRYRRPFPIDTVDSLLRSTNAELNSYYGKNPAARRVASSANPDTAMLDAQGQALRDALYNHLDAPQGGAAARQLQREYGTLSELEDAMQKRKNVALRQAPDSLSEQAAKWSSLGDVVRGGLKMLTPMFSEDPFKKFTSGASDVLTGLAKTRMAKWLKEQQTTDSLIQRAFANHTTPRIAPILPTPPPPFQPAGLLGSGPIITEPPADTSGWIRDGGPRMGMGMSPNVPPRGPAGLLDRAPIVTEPPPDTSGPIPGGGPRMGMGMSPKVQNAPKIFDGTIVRHRADPTLRMIWRNGEWHPL